jgi:hypothetical protein
MLALSGMDEGQAILAHRNQVFVDTVPYLVSGLVGSAVIIIVRRSRELKADSRRFSVLCAATAALAVAVAAGLFDGIASGISASWWDKPPLWAVDLVVTLSVIIPEIALIASVTAATSAVRSGQARGESQKLIKDIFSWKSIRQLAGLSNQGSSSAREGLDSTTASSGPSSTLAE